MKFVINKKDEGVYHFFLKDSEDRPVLWSPRYATKTQCRNGIESLRNYVKGKARFDEWQTDSGRYLFHLRSNDGHLLAMSAPFGNKMECTRHIIEVQDKVATATEEDLAF
jgi:uncharacterized protein